MLALSIRQPWAFLIVNGYKTIENRSWSTMLRGPIQIHAGKVMSDEDFDDAMGLLDQIHPMSRDDMIRRRARVINGAAPLGGIVGQAEVVGCVTQSDSPWFFGPYGFVLAKARTVLFRPCRGKLGFFDPDFTPAETKRQGELL